MVLVFPLLLLAAAVLVARGRDTSRGRGLRWLAAWAVAGAAMTFSFLTGFSIGLFVLPFAAAVLVLVARRSPHPREALGFLAGAAGVLLLVFV
jgi:lysylphosphatidylglycerol synthetase-like protein (DUF2156 family)